jgi:hypothetical protein
MQETDRLRRFARIGHRSHGRFARAARHSLQQPYAATLACKTIRRDIRCQTIRKEGHAMRLPTTTTLFGAAAALLLAPAYAQRADDAAAAPSTDDCIWLRQLEHAEVIDDQTILFHQTDYRVYRNHLPRECPGLEREGRFMYEAPTSQLCSIDAIAVLENWGTAALARGFTYALGEFQLVSDEEVAQIRAAAGRRDAAEDGRD